MAKKKKLPPLERSQLVEELHKKYEEANSFSSRFRYNRKKYSWIIVVGAAKAVKRIFDFAVSLILLIALSPIMLLIAFAIKLYDYGPIFYTSPRVGKWGKEFAFPKFRTMVVDADQKKESLMKENEADGITFKMKQDPRITPIGKILRKTSLDELPQLVCVIKGEMSLVGPRPPLPSEAALYTIKDRVRLDVLPGITCLWQVSGRSNIPFARQVKLDREYIESQSLWLDCKILLKTIPAVLSGRGAY